MNKTFSRICLVLAMNLNFHFVQLLLVGVSICNGIYPLPHCPMSRFCTPVDDDTIDDLCVFVLDVLLFEQRMDAGSP